MATLKCPYCENKIEWTTDMGVGRIQCPLCGKSLKVVRRRGKNGTRATAKPGSTAGWDTNGFSSAQSRARYGEIKKGDVLGGFRIEQMVGAGAMAVVYEATQLSLDRRVALKILPQEFATKESFVRQFDSETDLLASLNHPNIVSIIDRGREGNTYYFAMEYVAGTTLGELLSASEIEEEFLLDIFEQCAQALVYAHNKGIVHRDLKPANIMVNDQGMVKVTDFGVASLLAEVQEEAGGKRKVMGTRGYMPPEQEQHVSRADERSDIFSMGAVIYRILTGKVPDILPPAPPSKMNPEVDPRVDSLVLKCLQAAPGKRYQSAEEMLDAVRAYRRQVTGAEVVCPECQKENPVTQKTCLHCGADLSELFDVCPECGAENRIDVEICMSCGCSLKQRRHQTSVRISKIEEQARKHALKKEFSEAISRLQEVTEVKGKVFERARQKARRLIESYQEQREQHHRQQVAHARKMVRDGVLGAAAQVLEQVPEEFHEQFEVDAVEIDIKSRMALAKGRVQEARDHLAEKRYEEAHAALEKAGELWANCPGLEEVKQAYQNSQQTDQMVGYELQTARQQLADANFAAAREAMEFALTTMPDEPEVKRLLEEIDRREKQALLEQALRQGAEAADENRLAKAINHWQKALELLDEDDPRREKLTRRIGAAREKAVGTDIVSLRPATVVRLRPASILVGGGLSRRTLVGLLALVVVAIAIVGGLLLYLSMV
ncbi:MAG: protein kinase [Candidatus Brocadiia bacterium]